MKALAIEKFGGPDVLHLADFPDPVPAAGEVLIKIEASGLNRLDHYIREGSVADALPFPHILGSDAVGTVEALGKGTEGFSLGDRVIPMPGYTSEKNDELGSVLSARASYGIVGLARSGTYAELISVPADWVLRAPEGFDPSELATLPMALVTAVRAVRAVGAVVEGQTVVVHAGASGTGSFAIQVARALGARVAATIRTSEKKSFVESLGAELVVADNDPTEALLDWADGGADVVIDNLGGPNVARSLEQTKPLGIVVQMGNVLGLEANIPVRSLFFPQKQLRGTLMGDKGDLLWGLEQVGRGTIRPTLDTTFRLRDGAAAHERLAAGEQSGNIVFDLR